jgi:hypothetical protein
MEMTESVQSEENPKSSRHDFMMLIFLSISLSIGSGILTGWWFGRSSSSGREIVVIDVGKVIEEKRKEFVGKFGSKEPSPSMRAEMEKEISAFTERLNRAIEDKSRKNIILVKDSVLSEERDITDEVAQKVNERP